MATNPTATLVAELQQLRPRPTHLLVTVDGDPDDAAPRKVPVANVRKAWERLERALDALRWTRVEVWHKDETMGAFEAGDEERDDDSGGLTLRERELVRELRETYRDVTTAWKQATTALVTGMQQMAMAHRQSTQVYVAALEAKTQLELPAGDDDGEVDPLIELAGAIAGAGAKAKAEKRREGKPADRREKPKRPASRG